MAYSFRESNESKKDVTKDHSSNCTPIPVVKEGDNPFYEAPIKYGEPVEQEDCKIDIIHLIGQRSKQEIIASPNLALPKKGIGTGKKANIAHRVLVKLGSQDIARLESENLTVDDIKPKALGLASNPQLKSYKDDNIDTHLQLKKVTAPKETTKEKPKKGEIAPGIYDSPRLSTPCCGKNSICIIM